MAAPKRTAPIGSPMSIKDDLVLARDAGGLQRATAVRLDATITLLRLRGGISKQADPREIAINFLTGYVLTLCEEHTATHAGDVCEQAAAIALRNILLQPRDEQQKAETLRARAKTESGCLLTTHGIRKKEDLILRAVATRAHQDLSGEQIIVVPVVHIIGFASIANKAAANLHRSLMSLYDAMQTETESSEATFDVVYRMTYDIVAVQYSVRMARRALDEVPTPEPVYSLLSDLADYVLTRPFNNLDDRRVLLGLLDPAPLRDALWNDEALLERTLEWLASCHPECLYKRSKDADRYCEPHRLIDVLERFAEATWTTLRPGAVRAAFGGPKRRNS